MNESQTLITTYLQARNWDNLQPADMAKSIMIEGAELLELFQWKSHTVAEINANPELKLNIQKEIADVMIYAIELAIHLDIDVSEAIKMKIEHNSKKYPAAKIKDATSGDDFYMEQKIYHAIAFLYEKLKTSTNSKPVCFHSIRVASTLWNMNIDEEVVIAAILHDVVEDTDASLNEVEAEFGKKVARIVDACTFEDHSENYIEKLKLAIASINKARSIGPSALMVKAADFIDNSNYYSLAQTPDLKQYLYDKFMYFMEVAEVDLAGTKILERLNVIKYSHVIKK